MKKILILILILNLGLLLFAILHEWAHYNSQMRTSNIRKVPRDSIDSERPQTTSEVTADIIPDQLRVGQITSSLRHNLEGKQDDDTFGCSPSIQ